MEKFMAQNTLKEDHNHHSQLRLEMAAREEFGDMMLMDHQD